MKQKINGLQYKNGYPSDFEVVSEENEWWTDDEEFYEDQEEFVEDQVEFDEDQVELCKCPKCEKLHVARLHWTGKGVPRIYCPECSIWVQTLGSHMGVRSIICSESVEE